MSLISLVRQRQLPYGGPCVPGAQKRCKVEMTGTEFLENLNCTEIDESNCQCRVAVNPEGDIRLLNGKDKAPEGTGILPLRLAPLQKALQKVQDSQEWLMGEQPIFKTESNGNARIDFLNRGGFVFNQQGEELSHSVNPW